MARSIWGRIGAGIIAVTLGLAAGCDSNEDDSRDGTPGDKDASAKDAQNGAEEADADGTGDPLKLTLADGILQGKVDGETSCFLGIPYAKPPVGELRWKRPQRSDPWTGVRDATEFGKRCAQLSSTFDRNAASEDEDCLYLNVWTPDTAPDKPMPVMFWIHGGANYIGSASEPVPIFSNPDAVFYSGRYVAKNHGVVVVSLNYRLGVFGFMAHPALASGQTKAGNQGLWDQVFALQWVRDNITKFGGDPANVTIFGESAGSFDVCLHMASPASKGLFHHAISESGGCTTLQPTLQEGEASAAKLVSLLGCADAADPLTCLRGKSVAELLATSPVDDVTKLFEPVVDGEFLSDQPRALYDKGEIANVPYILGSNTDEGTLFVYQGSYPDEQAYTDALKRLFPVKPEDVAAVYPISPYPNGQPNPQTAALARAIGDADLVCPTLDAAQRAAKAGRSVFIYNFDISTGIAGLGASHGAEIAYVFGTSTRFTDQTRTASDLIQRYWTNFAKTGDPNSGADPTWAPFTASSDTRINFAATGPTQVNNFRATECAFWQRRYQATYDAAK